MVYVNGDSYACISDGRTYADFLGEYLQMRHTNSAIPGSCNSRIIRTTMRDLLRINDKNIYAVISLTFPLRTEIWDQELIGNNYFKNDGEFVSIQTTHSKRWFYDLESSTNTKYRGYIDQWLKWYSIEAETVNLLRDILLLTKWLQNRNIKYVIFSGCLQEPVDLTSDFIKDFYQEIKSDRNVIDIFSNSFTQVCLDHGHKPIDNFTQEIHGKTYIIGHHGEAAHRDFSKFLITNYFTEIDHA